MVRTLTRLMAIDDIAALKLLELLRKLEKSVPSEPQNLSYEVFINVEDPRIFYCLEIWETKDGFDGHLCHNEETGVNAEAAHLLMTAPETTFIAVIPSEG